MAEWTKKRGKSDRLYPGALVWCVRKPGRDLRDKVEMLLAWKRVQKDVRDGVLGSDFEQADLREIQVKVQDAEEEAKDEVWGGYRFVVLADSNEPDGLKTIDLGAGHSSGSETLCGRIIAALKAEALLNESVGAGYIDRNWPPAFKEFGAWPLASLRQSFLNGALTRLLDPDRVLRGKIAEFVERGDFGLASGPKPDGTYERVWFHEMCPADEVSFEMGGALLLKKDRATALKLATPPPSRGTEPQPDPGAGATPEPGPGMGTEPGPGPEPAPGPATTSVRVSGGIPPELWNRLGTRMLPKLRSGNNLSIQVSFEVSVGTESVADLRSELRQILTDLGLDGSATVE
jgi:hypothetical protein